MADSWEQLQSRIALFNAIGKSRALTNGETNRLEKLIQQEQRLLERGKPIANVGWGAEWDS